MTRGQILVNGSVPHNHISRLTSVWNFDQFSRVTNKVDAATNVVFVYTYDAKNRLTTRWTPAKGTASYLYDAEGNLTSISYATNHSITMKYDAVNRLTNMVDAVGTTVYAFTSGGLLQSEDGPWLNDTVTYSYQNRL